MGKITLRFVGGTSLVSDTIKRFEYGFWASHVEAVMPDGGVISADMDKGVAQFQIDYNAGTFDREIYVTIETAQSIVDKFYAFIHSQLGKPYDTEAVLGIGLGRDWRNDGSWFCSELDAAGLCEAGLFPSHLADDLNHVTPRDLLLILSGRADVSMSPSAPTPESQPA